MIRSITCPHPRPRTLRPGRLARSIAAISLLTLANLSALAQLPAPTTAPRSPSGPQQRIVRIDVKPAAPPRPALRNALLVPPEDLEVGNAAPLWLTALLRIQEAEASVEKLRLLNDAPAGKFDAESARRELANLKMVMGFARQAARRDHCQWELTVRQEGFNALMPQLSGARSLSAAIVAQARVDIAAGNYPEAIKSLRVGYALARDLGAEPLLIQALVAEAVAGRMNRAVEDFIASPGAPNLYWPLADLPRPLVDMRNAARFERAALYFTFPQLRELRGGATISPAAWDAVVSRLPALAGDGTPAGENQGALIALAMIKVYPDAKRWFIEHGTPRPQVEAMPVQQVLATYLIDSLEETWDELDKWYALPYWQAREGIERAEREFGRKRNAGELSYVAWAVPAFSQAYRRSLSSTREAAALQIVEGLRAYAAAHAGKWPASLDELAPDTPAPLDLVTGKPFAYRVEPGGIAVIDAPSPAAAQSSLGFRYELRVAP